MSAPEIQQGAGDIWPQHEREWLNLLRGSAAQLIPEPDDLTLAEAAGQWLLRRGSGWRPAYSGFLHARRGLLISADPDGRGLRVCRQRSDGTWPSHHERHPVTSVGQALVVLVMLEVLPARFSPQARQALQDAAQVYERVAATVEAGFQQLRAEAGPVSAAMMQPAFEARACAFRDAAASALSLAEAKVPD